MYRQTSHTIRNVELSIRRMLLREGVLKDFGREWDGKTEIYIYILSFVFFLLDHDDKDRL